MIWVGTGGGKEQWTDGNCGVGTGEQGPNRPAMGVGGEDEPDIVGVIGGGGIVEGAEGLIAEKPRTPPSEMRENAEGALLVP
jgi:hypothetical protein